MIENHHRIPVWTYGAYGLESVYVGRYASILRHNLKELRLREKWCHIMCL